MADKNMISIDDDLISYIGEANNEDVADGAGLKNYKRDKHIYLGKFKNGIENEIGAYLSDSVNKLGYFNASGLNGAGVKVGADKIEFGFFKNDILESGLSIDRSLNIDYKVLAYPKVKLRISIRNNKVLSMYSGEKFSRPLESVNFDFKDDIYLKETKEGSLNAIKYCDYFEFLGYEVIDDVNVPLPKISKPGFVLLLKTNNDINKLVLKDKDSLFEIANSNEVSFMANSFEFKSSLDGYSALDFEITDKLSLFYDFKFQFEKGYFKITFKRSNRIIYLDKDLKLSVKKSLIDLKIPKNLDSINENAEEELEKLIGLKSVKKNIKRIKAYALKSGKGDLNLHMAFLGNPGTGKTTVARLVRDIFFLNGILDSPNFINGNRSTLVGKYVGETGEKTNEAIKNAMGGVLLIDEAYALNGGYKNDFGQEAVANLIAGMENNRGKFCCILAGYTKEMNDLFKTNPGFISRIQFLIDFEDYNSDEMKLIARGFLTELKLKASEEVLDKIIKILNYQKENTDFFGNARDVRKIIEALQMIVIDRNSRSNEITFGDIDLYMSENTIVASSLKRARALSSLRLLEEYDSEFTSAKYEASRACQKEAVLQIVNSYDKEQVRTSGVIINKGGYAITIMIDTSECTRSKAERLIIDRLGNPVRVSADVSIASKNSKINIIKLPEGNIYPYIPLDKDYKPCVGEELMVVGTVLDGSITSVSNPFVEIRANIERIYDSEVFTIGCMNNQKFVNGSAVINPQTSMLVGILLSDGSVIPASILFKLIENEEK